MARVSIWFLYPAYILAICFSISFQMCFPAPKGAVMFPLTGYLYRPRGFQRYYTPKKADATLQMVCCLRDEDLTWHRSSLAPVCKD